MALSPKQRLFVEAYDGNLAMSMRVAGYTGSDSYLEQQGGKLLAEPHIQEAIRERSRYLGQTQRVIADRQERQEWWTNLMRNEDPHAIPEVDSNGRTKPRENIPLNIRLKASEHLAKVDGDFVDRLDITGSLTISDLVTQAYQVSTDDLDVIEAEYERLRGSSHDRLKEDMNKTTTEPQQQRPALPPPPPPQAPTGDLGDLF